MLNRKQIHALLMIRERPGNVLSGIPKELIGVIADAGSDKETADLLSRVANGVVAPIKTGPLFVN